MPKLKVVIIFIFPTVPVMQNVWRWYWMEQWENLCAPFSFICQSPTPQFGSSRRWVFGRYEVMRVSPCRWQWFRVFMDGNEQRPQRGPLPFSTMWWHHRRHLYETHKMGASPNPDFTVILQPPEFWETNHSCLSLPVYNTWLYQHTVTKTGKTIALASEKSWVCFFVAIWYCLRKI